eukprot:CAMPEP_0179256916 /NCGR_PEP_ID=MMETSP0797-20121207/24516_1 /TAXON_ID=47934 /ORGANISM="Dinophysis acuminata, Strain DAEP01" /LENGTH=56 /DNA_ID=CAMNT_0020964871 /DNA_START=41 /DNA_END=211 /DNA_ORIENTATION=+
MGCDPPNVLGGRTAPGRAKHGVSARRPEARIPTRSAPLACEAAAKAWRGSCTALRA